MEIPKVTKRNHYEEIAAVIRQQIEDGKLRPGDRLPSTKELCEHFNVGRSTMREALSALKAIGLIDIRQGEGTAVRKVEADDLDFSLKSKLIGEHTILELLEARKALEISNAALAAEKRTDHDLEKFDTILKRMENQVGENTSGEKMDIAFHVTLSEATHNAVMVRLLQSISEPMEAAIKETRKLYVYDDAAVSKRLWQEHRKIYDAIRDRNAVRAEEEMRLHLLHVEQIIKKYLKETIYSF